MKKSIGFFLSIVTTILAVVGFAFYGGVLRTATVVKPLLIAAIVLSALTVVIGLVKGGELGNFLTVANAIVIMAVAGLSTAPMVNEIAYVYAGLNPQSNVAGFYRFITVILVAWLVNLIASFGGVTKKA